MLSKLSSGKLGRSAKRLLGRTNSQKDNTAAYTDSSHVVLMNAELGGGVTTEQEVFLLRGQLDALRQQLNCRSASVDVTWQPSVISRFTPTPLAVFLVTLMHQCQAQLRL